MENAMLNSLMQVMEAKTAFIFKYGLFKKNPTMSF